MLTPNAFTFPLFPEFQMLLLPLPAPSTHPDDEEVIYLHNLFLNVSDFHLQNSEYILLKIITDTRTYGTFCLNHHLFTQLRCQRISKYCFGFSACINICMIKKINSTLQCSFSQTSYRFSSDKPVILMHPIPILDTLSILSLI